MELISGEDEATISPSSTSGSNEEGYPRSRFSVGAFTQGMSKALAPEALQDKSIKSPTLSMPKTTRPQVVDVKQAVASSR
ncbi:hypothetical protein ACLKA6_014495 [Drosophila palustris]